MNVEKFQRFILDWYRKNNRDYLPWRVTKTRAVSPYEIFVSEIMLQQTQVARVLEKYPQFLKAFPAVHHLAKAPLEKVLRVWQGMGYNRRARYLKKAAENIVKSHKGAVPSDPALLRTLPGIGHYTAGAIACFAYNKPVVFLDTNIRKILLKWFFCAYCNKLPRQNIVVSLALARKDKKEKEDKEDKEDKIGDREFLKIAESVCYKKDPRQWHYALMDYGTAMLTKEKGLLERAKSYHKQSRFEGSPRYWRSQIVKYLLQYRQASREELQVRVPCDIQPLVVSLVKDGLVEAASPDLYRISR